MLNRTPMKRTGMRRSAAPAKKELNRGQALALRAQRAIKNAPPRSAVEKPEKSALAHVNTASLATQFVAAIPKDGHLRSEPYRRLVAGLPCVNCCIVGYSQAAHPPPTAKGMKEDDRMCFPLCCARPGEHGCHYLYDQNKLMPREAMRLQAGIWANQVRTVIRGMGMWPKGLPFWSAP